MRVILILIYSFLGTFRVIALYRGPEKLEQKVVKIQLNLKRCLFDEPQLIYLKVENSVKAVPLLSSVYRRMHYPILGRSE